MTGWGTNDTHALASNLKYGLDNWLWGTVGYSGFRGTIERQGTAHVAGGLSLLVRRQEASSTSRTSRTTRGASGFNETIDVFGSTANNDHSVYVRDPAATLPGRERTGRDGKKKIDGHYALQANTQKVRQVDVQGGFTAVAGHNFYTARAFPEEYWNRIAFVNEPTAHVIHNAIIEKKGAGFAESRRLEPRRERRRVDGAGARGSRPRRRGVVPRLLRLHHPAQPDAGRAAPAGLRLPERHGQRVRHAAARHRRRTHLSRRLEGRQAVHADLAPRRPSGGARRRAQERQHVLAHHGAATARRARQARRAAAALSRSRTTARWTRSASTPARSTRCGRCTDSARSTARTRRRSTSRSARSRIRPGRRAQGRAVACCRRLRRRWAISSPPRRSTTRT